MLLEANDLWVMPSSSSLERARRTCRATSAREDTEENLEPGWMWLVKESWYHSDTRTNLSAANAE